MSLSSEQDSRVLHSRALPAGACAAVQWLPPELLGGGEVGTWSVHVATEGPEEWDLYGWAVLDAPASVDREHLREAVQQVYPRAWLGHLILGTRVGAQAGTPDEWWCEVPVYPVHVGGDQQ